MYFTITHTVPLSYVIQKNNEEKSMDYKKVHIRLIIVEMHIVHKAHHFVGVINLIEP